MKNTLIHIRLKQPPFLAGLFTFTGKERDAETGYSYFGSRYLDHELIPSWLSVDPMADKYPGISPYAYCAWNPIKLVDPNGEEIWIGQFSDNKKTQYVPGHGTGHIGKMLDKIYNGSKAGKFIINKLSEREEKYYISGQRGSDGETDNPHYTAKHRQIYLSTKKNGENEYTLSHELFHAFQHSEGECLQTRSNEVEAFIFAGIVMNQIGGKLDQTLMSKGMSRAFNAESSLSQKGNSYVKAMHSLVMKFDAHNMAVAVSHFLNYSAEGVYYGNDKGYKYCRTGEKYNSTSSLLNKYSNYLY